MTYGKRLQQALELARKDRASLATELHVSVQAVGQVITGGRSGVQTFTAENNAKAARFLRVDPDWLATGEGQATSERVWPFALLTPDHVRQLSPKALQSVENLALSLLEIQAPPPTERQHDSLQTDTVVAPRSPGYPGTQAKPEFMKDKSGQRSTDSRTSRKRGNG